MSIFASIKNFFSRGKAPVAKAAPGVAGPDRPGLDSLQSKADASAQVSGLQQLSDTATRATGAQEAAVEAPAQPSLSDFKVTDQKTKVKDREATEFHERTAGMVAGAASAANDGKGAATMAVGKTASVSVDLKAVDFVTTGMQHALQTLYAARDLYETRDWKSASAMLLDVINGLLAVEEKVKVIGLGDAIPFIGGAITGFRQMINASRVNESMSTMEAVMNKVSLDEKDKKVLAAFKKEQTINQYKHITQSLLSFGKVIGDAFGVGTVFSIVSGMVGAVAAIRDKWISYREGVVMKAQDRLGMEDGPEDDDRGSLEELNDVMNIEAGIRVSAALSEDVEDQLTGSKFSIMRLTESYNAWQTNRRVLDGTPKDDPSYKELEAKTAALESGLKAAIDEYNQEMAQLTAKHFGAVFKPVSLTQVEKLHDFHITCMHRLLQQGKERQDFVDGSVSILRPFMKKQDKQVYLKQIYNGRVPEKVDIKLADTTADADAYFWSKTRSAISNALLSTQMSKATIVKEMRQIMLRNQAEILDKMDGKGELFQSADTFENDMNRVLNTLTL